ncbi:MAG TPA: hypothetical protein VKH19_13850 [Gemmatimonadaceae bacterium]|nr:hypothetical protein [Gemmatimonadaceae bacterium]
MALFACEQDPVEWQEARNLPADLSRADGLSFDARGQLTPRRVADVVSPRFPGQCASSVRVARDSTGPWYASWWSLRPDSTADLVVARSSDGRSWDVPVRVDTLDAGATACRRPPPSLYVDGDDVHVAYAMAAREGAGIFASHSMDRGTMFHTPVPIVYGNQPGLAAIAARGNTVAVAYEDPNTNPRRIGLAISRTQGHTFDIRELVSPPTGAAAEPGVVVTGTMLAVTWARASDDGARSTNAPRILREGRIR